MFVGKTQGPYIFLAVAYLSQTSTLKNHSNFSEFVNKAYLPTDRTVLKKLLNYFTIKNSKIIKKSFFDITGNKKFCITSKHLLSDPKRRVLNICPTSVGTR